LPRDWLETEGDDDARSRAGEFWRALSDDLSAGEFWADRIKAYRGEPAKRLALAMENLPLPAAFREGAIATRALIRAKRREDEDFEEELTLLYWLAAVRSFILDYAPRLKQPGFNVVQSIPGDRILGLRYSYDELGYEELDLLNKTDVKWLREVWGEPSAHTTLNALHADVWNEYEDKLIEAEAARWEEFEAELQGAVQGVEPEEKNVGCGTFSVLGLAILFSILAVG